MPAVRLPAHLVARLNPAIWRERRERIASAVADEQGERVHLRRCAELVTHHLLETHAEAPS